MGNLKDLHAFSPLEYGNVVSGVLPVCTSIYYSYMYMDGRAAR
jgi:hypothetical protein